MEDATKLPQTDADLFNHFLTHILYISNQALPDINLEVSFLCTRIINTDTDDYKKSLQGYQFHFLGYIFLGIHEEDTLSYNLSGISLQVKIEKK